MFGIHITDLHSCHAQEGCASIQHAHIYPVGFCSHSDAPMGQRCCTKRQEWRCWHPAHFSSLSFPLRAGRKCSEQEGEWIAGRTHGVGASVVKTAKLPMLTGRLHHGKFMQNQRKRKAFAKGKTVGVNENMYMCFVRVLNHLNDNWWMHFNCRLLKSLNRKYKTSLLEKEGSNIARRKHVANKVRWCLLGESRAISIQPPLVPITLLKMSYQSMWNLATWQITSLKSSVIRDPKHNDRVISKSFFAQHENSSKLFIETLHNGSHGICVKIHAKEHLNLSKEFEITKLFKKTSFQGE